MTFTGKLADRGIGFLNSRFRLHTGLYAAPSSADLARHLERAAPARDNTGFGPGFADLVVCRVSPVAHFGEPGALVARTQDAVALGPFGKDEDAASDVIWPLRCQRTCETGH